MIFFSPENHKDKLICCCKYGGMQIHQISQTPHCSDAWDCDPPTIRVLTDARNENRMIPHLTRHGGKRGAEWFGWTCVRNVGRAGNTSHSLESWMWVSGTWPSPSSWVGSGTQKFTPVLLHKSTAGVNCFMPLLGFLHLIYNGNCVRLQAGHFPALPRCDSLKASQPLCWKSLTAIENNKENKRGQMSEFPLAMRDQSAVQHTFCGAGCSKERSPDSQQNNMTLFHPSDNTQLTAPCNPRSNLGFHWFYWGWLCLHRQHLVHFTEQRASQGSAPKRICLESALIIIIRW